MLAQPWLGPWRGLGRALGGSAHASARTIAPQAEHEASPPWVAAARQRRRVLLLLTAAFAALGAVFMAAATPPDAGLIAWLHGALGVTLVAWIGAGMATALMGAVVMLRGDLHALTLRPARAPIHASARTAVIMPICNEDITTVFAGLRATCESLASTGALRLFDFYLLSDTTDPALRTAELQAWQRLRAMLGDDLANASVPGDDARIFYRWRRRRTRRKSGNVANFCRRWGARYRYMVVLDADSTMRGDTLVALVRLMEQHPQAGIIQTLPQPYGHRTLHARVQQFASRVTGRLFALGMAYWQLGDSHYWGHNAIIRVAPFMQHCALATLPGRGALAGDILSHDFVEAALMRRAGYGVWLAPDLGGSWEQLPPNLLEELQRDRRWCRGNLQNVRLVAEPGFSAAHRAMLAVGAMSYVMAPLWLIFVALGVFVAGAAADEGVTATASTSLWVLTLTLLLAPRLLGVAAVRLAGEHKQFGGTGKLLASALLEMGVSTLQAPVRMLAHSAFVLAPLLGLALEWRSPPREAQSIAWREALTRIGTLAALPAAFALLVLFGDDSASPHLMALLLLWLAAVPLTVLGSRVKIGAALERRKWLRVPDEHRPPRVLARAIERLGFRDLVPAQPKATASVRALIPLGRRRWAWPTLQLRRAPAFAAAFALAFVALLVPRGALTSGEQQAELLTQAALDSSSVGVATARPRMEIPSLQSSPPTLERRTAERTRPAQMVDDALRERAIAWVQRRLEGDDADVQS